MKQATNMNFVFTSKASKHARIHNSHAENTLETELMNIERLKRVQLSQLEASYRSFKKKVREKRLKMRSKETDKYSQNHLPPLIPDTLVTERDVDETKDDKKSEHFFTNTLSLPPIIMQTRNKKSFPASGRRKSVSFEIGINIKQKSQEQTSPNLARRKMSLGLELTPPTRLRRKSLNPTSLEDIRALGSTGRRGASITTTSSVRQRSASVDEGILRLHGKNALKERLRRLANMHSIFYDEDDSEEDEGPESELGNLFEELKGCRYLRLRGAEADTDLSNVFS